MKFAYSAAAVAVALTLTACERETKTTVTEPSPAPSVSTQVERQVENASATVDDAAITTKIKAELLADPGVKGFAINVDTNANVVTLTGAVASAEARDKAVQIAKGVSGVKDVTNNLTIGENSSAGASADATKASEPMMHLQKAAQRLRESIQAMAQEKPGTRRNQAIKDAQDALVEAKGAMAQLPPEFRDSAPADSTGSTSGSGASGSTGSNKGDSSKAMERLQKAAQQLRESSQAMAQEPAGPRRNEAIRTSNRALMDVNEAMTQLPPEMRAAK